VVDEAGIFDQPSLTALKRALVKFKLEYGPEIQILILTSLDGEPIEDLSYQVMSKWKIGDRNRDDGVLFTVALNDRKMRIEVGDGLEGTLTDLASNRIIQQIRPYFRQAAYRDGVLAGAALIAKQLGGTLSAAPPPPRRRRRGGGSFFSIFILFIIFSIFSGRGRGGGMGLIQGMILGSMLSGGGRGGSDSDIFSGGFGGGGDFSGGGASGDW
jgi:uncharacterized protein